MRVSIGLESAQRARPKGPYNISLRFVEFWKKDTCDYQKRSAWMTRTNREV